MINLYFHSHIKSVFTGIELSLLLGIEGRSEMTKIMNEIMTKIKYNTDHSHTHTLWPFNAEFWGYIFLTSISSRTGGSNGLRKIWHIEM